MRTVTAEEIATASNVPTALKGELRSQTKRRMDRVPNNVSWNEKLTWIDFDLRESLESIHRETGTETLDQTTPQSRSRQHSHLMLNPQQPPNYAPLLWGINYSANTSITVRQIPRWDGPKHNIVTITPRTSKRGRLNKSTEFRPSARNGTVARRIVAGA